MWRPWNKSTVQIHHTSSSPTSPFSFSSFKDIQLLCAADDNPPPSAAVKKASAIFHRVRVANSLLRAFNSTRSKEENDTSSNSISLPGSEKRIVIYYTSLRVVRRTHEDCHAVRSILRGFRVNLDERDLSMDQRFITELQQILGQRKSLTLPRVFIDGRYIGGAEEVKQLHESGELKKIMEGLPVEEYGACGACGGYKFLLCGECNGSHKLYSEKGGFRCCGCCNENGLIRCPNCLCAPMLI